MIAERIKKWLPIIILEEQGGFIARRQILDGVVIATEAIHSMATSREREMFVKLDMAKAYDRVKWSFLRNILLTFVFGSNWVSWTMSCVTSASFQFFLMINLLSYLMPLEASARVTLSPHIYSSSWPRLGQIH